MTAAAGFYVPWFRRQGQGAARPYWLTQRQSGCPPLNSLPARAVAIHPIPT